MYSLKRESIQTGHLFFTASPAFFSRLIRFFTRSHVSHVGIFMWIGERLFIVESIEGSGVVMTLASERIKSEKDVWIGEPVKQLVGNSDELMKKIMLENLGKGYDMKGALLSLLFDTKTAQVFCSEFASRVIGYKPELSKRGITPDDLTKICKIEKIR